MSVFQAQYLQPPATIINQALDRLGKAEKIIGDISDGTPIAETARRNYGQILRQLLRTAHWGFARYQIALTLLGDSTGQTTNVSTNVEQPWTYAYAWPTDGVAGRWMPLTTNAAPQNSSNTPLVTNAGGIPPIPLLPARFLISSSSFYPINIGVQPWDQQPDLQRTEGLGPINRKIILTDQQNALFVYTRLVTVIEEWDDAFREAMVATMAYILTPVAVDDPKERMELRKTMLAISKNVIADARVANGNDAGFPQSTDHMPAWITARNGGGYGYGPSAVGAGAGSLGLYLPWEPWSLGGSVY